MNDNKKQKLVTVLIPCYNVEKYLKKLFDSILRQKNLEIVKFIFLDDVSNDSTLDKLSNFKKSYPNLDIIIIIIIKDKVTGGIAEARNTLIRHVDTEYFYFIDPDDYFTGKLIFSKLEKLIQNKTYDLIVLKWKLRYQINKYDFLINKITIKSPLHNHVKPMKNHEINPAEYICKNGSQNANIFIKTSYFKTLNVSYIKGHTFEDIPVGYLMFLRANSAYFINYYSYVYCSRPTGVSRTPNFSKLSDVAENVNYLYEKLTAYNKLDWFTSRIESRFLRGVLLTLVNKNAYKTSLSDLKKYQDYFLIIWNVMTKWQINKRLDNTKSNWILNLGYKRLKKIIQNIKQQ